jgi:hypothetical protein
MATAASAIWKWSPLSRCLPHFLPPFFVLTPSPLRQGEVSPRRKDIIRQAFVMMDRVGARRITLETFLNHFHVQAYPDVASGHKTEWKALKEIEDFFLYCSHGVPPSPSPSCGLTSCSSLRMARPWRQ